ncbi:Acyltransferase 3 [marine gamma proteobacterium HTCC2080]|nr:Acyltransferase 3 [marine gamma proteobacterium HTCC2080]
MIDRPEDKKTPHPVLYRPDIDGLRAISVLAVMLYHAEFQVFSGGFIGVDVFFVISGYLITQMVLGDFEKGSFSLSHFYERRVRRILPALLVMLAATVPLAYVFLSADPLADYSAALLGATWFSSNFVFWSEAGYFDRASEFKPLLHTWSLGVEEQFYLFFPAFFWVLYKFKWLIPGLSAVVVISFLMAQFGLSRDAEWPFYMLVSRAWELGLGAMLAVVLAHSRLSDVRVTGLLAELLVLSGLLAVIVPVLMFSELTATPGPLLLVPTLGACLLIWLTPATSYVRRLLSLKWLVGLGLISYSLYLWHQPVLVFGRIIIGEALGFEWRIAMLLGTFPLAILSWRYIERPFRNPGQIVTRHLIFLVCAMMMITTLSAVTLHHFASTDEKTSTGVVGDIGHGRYYEVVDQRFDRCEAEYLQYRIELWENVPRCHKSKRAGAPGIAFYGDSHAEQLFVGAEALLSQASIYLIRGGIPFLGNDRFKGPLRYLEEQKGINVVVFSAYWLEKIQILGGDQFSEQLFNTVKWMVGRGFKVVLMMDAPDFGFDPALCVYETTLNDVRCDISLEQHNGDQAIYRALFVAIAKHPNVELVDISDAICNKNTCSMLSEGRLLYRDNDHLNLIGSQLAGEILIQKSKFLSQ